jgi:deoxyribose-phosphate aldolase
MSYSLQELAKTIDHALLKPELTSAEVIEGCKLAATYGVFLVCVKPCHIRLACGELTGSDVLVGTVIGFPHGGQTEANKGAEAEDAVARGAKELDMVINIAALIESEFAQVRSDIEAVVRASEGLIVKTILETAYLTDEQIRIGCRIAEASGARFVKTSTGFASHGATVEHVRLMRASVGSGMQVKASGGIRSHADAVAMLDAGATRLGTTGTVAILSGIGESSNAY